MDNQEYCAPEENGSNPPPPGIADIQYHPQSLQTSFVFADGSGMLLAAELSDFDEQPDTWVMAPPPPPHTANRDSKCITKMVFDNGSNDSNTLLAVAFADSSVHIYRICMQQQAEHHHHHVVKVTGAIADLSLRLWGFTLKDTGKVACMQFAEGNAKDTSILAVGFR
jgi:hypothetical protein